jgi:hypothetical protein
MTSAEVRGRIPPLQGKRAEVGLAHLLTHCPAPLLARADEVIE